MITRLLFILFCFTIELIAESKVHTKIEAGIYFPVLDGSINNTTSSFSLSQDNNYSDATASYFALDIFVEYDYAPNLRVDYFYMQTNQDARLSKSVLIADGVFSSSISSVIDFNVLNTVLYQDFKQRGQLFSLLGSKYYTGDFEIDVGINGKYILWNYEVQDRTNLNSSTSWVRVNQFIPLPYFGFKYYLYDFSFYSNISTLSFVEAKSMNYQVGITYNVIGGVSLSAAYLYEEFEAVEIKDTIKFNTSGYKFSFMYAF
ncbi:hypothetical protein JHD49_04360 [Sulfurimonas sp. SAG-AH-194-C21]|nr:hypothetical protein [Sulfurimonas sp. SAG-AH-194-C21]MDF1883164.1 hypothetical protein [Sulfurimonas sp. SAG-AH-194-C21]